MISFKRIDIDEMHWDELRAFKDASVFQTRPWIDFMADFFRAEPVVAAVQSGDQIVGYFTGLIIKKFGLRILGSPFRGSNAYFMGFTLMPGVSFRELLQALPGFVFNELKCHFLMLVDLNLKGDEWKGLSYHARNITYYSLDLTKSEEELFGNMENRYARRAIRRAIKKGVVIEEATDPGFADEYYRQYQEVMGNQSLAPFYSLDYVRQMIEHLLPTGILLLLRARNAEGVCIATSINLIFNKVAVAWGAASWRRYLNLNPNELIYWYGMKRVKSMGAEVFHMADTKMQWKIKLGCYEMKVFRLMKAKHPLLYIPIFVGISIDERVRSIMRKLSG
jgi:hypothetical protein